MSRSERHTALDWAEQLDNKRSATQAELDAAIRCHVAHDAGCLADIGIDSPCDQEQTHTPDSGIPSDRTLLLVAVCGVAAAVLASWLMPTPWF